MKLKIRDLHLQSGGPLIAAINHQDAELLDLHPLDRVKIITQDCIETVVLDVGHAVRRGEIGVFSEVFKRLDVRSGDVVRIMLARKPLSLEFIKKKLDGLHLTKKEIEQIVWDIVHNKLSDIELTFFIAASYAHKNNMDETVWLTEAMAKEGERLKLRKRIILDKHCIGGIPGNRTTMIVVPMLAALGYTMPKTSSRAITSPAGTADTMEVLADVVFPLDRMRDIVGKTNACIVWGGALNLAPADDKIITVEKSLMIDAESQLLASIMAKKHSVSSTHVVIDIPVGPNTKITTTKKANHLKRKFETLGKKLGMKIRVVLTDGKEPIGNGIGPALEARDVLKVLRQENDRPIDLENKCIKLACELLKLVGKKGCAKLAHDVLHSGKAYDKFKEIVALQGGNPDIKPEDVPIAHETFVYKAHKGGTIKAINNIAMAKLARIAGAPQTKGAGIDLHVHIGQKIKKGQALCTVYSASKPKLYYAKKMIDELDGIEI